MVGVLAVLAGVLALLSLAVGLAGVDGDAEVLADEAALLAAGADVADYIRASFWLNMFGNYLLLVPLALLLHVLCADGRRADAWLLTVAGGVYLLFGAAGSAIFAGAWPDLIEKYAAAGGEAERAAILADFELVSAIAGDGLHGIVQNVAGAAWLVGIGALMRTWVPSLGWLAMAIGAFLAITTVGTMFGAEALNLVGVTATVLLAPIWSIAVGLRLILTPPSALTY